MKKRVKLLTTIASLCLAVALMAFGVYAAANPTFNATGSLSFTSSDVDGTWTIVSVTVSDGDSFEEAVDATKIAGYNTAIAGGNGATIEIPAVTVGSDGKATVTIEVKYTPAEGSDKADLTATGSATADTESTLTFTDDSATDVAAETTLTVEVDFSTETYNSAEASYKFAFVAARAASYNA